MILAMGEERYFFLSHKSQGEKMYPNLFLFIFYPVVSVSFI
jgi:hypothetical protein